MKNDPIIIENLFVLVGALTVLAVALGFFAIAIYWAVRARNYRLAAAEIGVTAVVAYLFVLVASYIVAASP